MFSRSRGASRSRSLLVSLVLLAAAPAAAAASEPPPPEIDGPAPASAERTAACDGSPVAFCGGVVDAAATLRQLAADQPAEVTQQAQADESAARTACATDDAGCVKATGDLAAASAFMPRAAQPGPQVPIAATAVYGQAGSDGAAVVCFVGVGTGTPRFYRGDSRYIAYSGSVYCPTGAKGRVSMSITEVTLKDAVTNQVLGTSPQYGPYVIEKEGGTTGNTYTRTSDTQAQYIKIQAILDVVSNPEGAANGWNVVPPQCTKLSKTRVRCDFQSGAFTFVPTTVPAPADALAFFDSVYGQFDAETDVAIDALVAAGEPYASIIDGLVGGPVGGVINGTTPLLYGLPIVGDAVQVVKCAAAIAGFVAGNIILVTKIRKAGGFVKVAKKLIKARDPEKALEAIVAGAGDIAGITAVVNACS